MRITINNYHAVAIWRWNLKYGLAQSSQGQDVAQSGGPDAARTGKGDGRGQAQEHEEEEEDDDDVCGICRVAFDGCCPECKVPGDGCPLIWGECTHVFHMHCLLKWLSTESSKHQCPLDRRAWVTVGSADKTNQTAAHPPPQVANPETMQTRA